MKYTLEERSDMIIYLNNKISLKLSDELSEAERIKMAILNIKLTFLLNWLCYGVYPSASVADIGIYWDDKFVKYTERKGVCFEEGSLEKRLEEQMVKESIQHTNEEIRRHR